MVNRTIVSANIESGTRGIAGSAFYGCNGLISVVIGDSVTSIGGSAFYGCYRLIEVCNKSKLNIKAGNKDYGCVGYYAKNVYNPDSGTSKLSTDDNGYIIYTDGDDRILVVYTGEETDLILPSDITGIYHYAFYNCDGLTSIVS